MQNYALTIVAEEKVCDSDGVAGHIFPSELGSHSILLPEGPVLVLHMHRKHRRMVAHLRGGLLLEFYCV